MPDLQAQLKALVAGGVGFVLTWIATRFGIKIDSPEIQSGLTTIILYLAVYWTTNKSAGA